MNKREANQFTRRRFLGASALAGGSAILPVSAMAQNSTQMPMPAATPTPPVATGPADVTLRIATDLVELAPDHIVSTTLYNGQFPGPLLHPLLHRHSFELVRVGGKPTAGIIKDVVMLGGFHEVEFDFVADNPGLTLFHCHQQLHMDFGFMQLIEYV